MTILGCAHPQYGAVAQMVFRFYRWHTGYGTRSQNKTILHFFEKGRLIITKELNIVFYYFTFDYSIEMDQNNLAIILNTTNLHYYKTDYYEIQKFLSVPKIVYILLNKTTFWGMGIFSHSKLRRKI